MEEIKDNLFLKLVNKYFTDDEINEFLITGNIRKLDLISNYSKDELEQILNPKEMTAREFLNILKRKYKLSYDKELADILKVKKITLDKWLIRKKIPNHIINKFSI